MTSLVAGGEDLTIVGIVQPSEDANGLLLSSGIRIYGVFNKTCG